MVLNALICVLFAIKWFYFPFQIIKKTSYLLILGILPALMALDGTISTLGPMGHPTTVKVENYTINRDIAALSPTISLIQ